MVCLPRWERVPKKKDDEGWLTLFNRRLTRKQLGKVKLPGRLKDRRLLKPEEITPVLPDEI
jgi:hypothetical protein